MGEPVGPNAKALGWCCGMHMYVGSSLLHLSFLFPSRSVLTQVTATLPLTVKSTLKQLTQWPIYMQELLWWPVCVCVCVGGGGDNPPSSVLTPPGTSVPTTAS